ncbi:cytochrome b/b6 domain-containing protein [Paracoccus spongiarum]|uniref:Cytochrome b/b6 domain-containing protein n=1 Tax=Paracoccus spongiarum TaxID=3064387 RepID=A0ABT9JE84_9RHOB|nr:cytochrome b/b6 domain-containing protein [Paracoccus sp. 2205BS29-5]MDP5308139.1 cytochrome b/b6 domain-containing protein [Paracoccus sp. 2205BS29-5]
MTRHSDPASPKAACGRDSVRIVPVWDPLVRAVHWLLAATILVNGLLSDPESDLHETLGYVALGLLVLRLGWGLIGPRPARLASFPPYPLRALHHLRAVLTGDRTVHLTHNPLGALMVWNIWGSLGIIIATGIMMGTRRFFGVDWVEEVHEAMFDWLLLSVVLHVGGVIFDSRRSGVPLVRAMIDGRKRIPADAPIE